MSGKSNSTMSQRAASSPAIRDASTFVYFLSLVNVTRVTHRCESLARVVESPLSNCRVIIIDALRTVHFFPQPSKLIFTLPSREIFKISETSDSTSLNASQNQSNILKCIDRPYVAPYSRYAILQ